MRQLIKYCVFLILVNLAIGQNLQWREVGRMPVPVKGHRAIALDSVILIIGGFSDSLNSPIDLIQEYNPQTNKWRIIGQTKFRRTNFLSSKSGDSLLIYGGITRSYNPRDYYTLEVWKQNFSPYIYKYNPIFNRTFFTGVSIDNKIYIFGGKKAYVHQDTSRMNFFVEYDFKKDSVLFAIERLQDTPEQPFYQSTAKLNDNIFIFGGVSIGISNRIYRYNITSRSLNRISLNLLVPRAGSEAIDLSNNSIMIIGGFNENSKALRSTEIFNFYGTSFSIEQGPPMLYPRREFAAVKFRNSIYVFGGENQFDNIVPFVEKLDLRTSTENDNPAVMNEIELHQNFPNPFNPTTTISFKISQKSKVFLEIFDIFGKQVKLLLNDELEPGEHLVIWNGFDNDGKKVSSGVYFYRISLGKTTITKKMILAK
ncbi:MAG: T9SS type A sorting domain-containing protein [Ignavibacteria bacterium]|nr:T9SS type A sorting domain-containing protein [Ignavibacteria bacterium]